jgi:hypothetical protein
MRLKINFFIILMAVFQVESMVSQTVEIYGKIESNDDVENIHIINKTARVFTISNQAGNFKISAKINDTLVFSSVQYQTKILVIDENILINKRVNVFLEEHINELDEVFVGKFLTGDLLSDINNTEGEPPINFYDVGIPGYTGKIATQSERRLNEATTGGGIIPLNPILNAISGRTKMLKQQVALEAKDELLFSIKARLSEVFFELNPLEESLIMDFFYFCQEDENFMNACKNQSDLKILQFLGNQYNQYINNLKLKQD